MTTETPLGRIRAWIASPVSTVGFAVAVAAGHSPRRVGDLVGRRGHLGEPRRQPPQVGCHRCPRPARGAHRRRRRARCRRRRLPERRPGDSRSRQQSVAGGRCAAPRELRARQQRRSARSRRPARRRERSSSTPGRSRWAHRRSGGARPGVRRPGRLGGRAPAPGRAVPDRRPSRRAAHRIEARRATGLTQGTADAARLPSADRHHRRRQGVAWPLGPRAARRRAARVRSRVHLQAAAAGARGRTRACRARRGLARRRDARGDAQPRRAPGGDARVGDRGDARRRRCTASRREEDRRARRTARPATRCGSTSTTPSTDRR